MTNLYSNNIDTALDVVDNMLRTRKERLRVRDCLAVSALADEVRRLRSARKSDQKLIDELDEQVAYFSNPQNWG